MTTSNILILLLLLISVGIAWKLYREINAHDKTYLDLRVARIENDILRDEIEQLKRQLEIKEEGNGAG